MPIFAKKIEKIAQIIGKATAIRRKFLDFCQQLGENGVVSKVFHSTADALMQTAGTILKTNFCTGATAFCGWHTI